MKGKILCYSCDLEEMVLTKKTQKDRVGTWAWGFVYECFECPKCGVSALTEEQMKKKQAGFRGKK